MKENKFHKKTEDYLTDDAWVERIKEIDSSGKTSDDDFNLASNFVKSIANHEQSLTPADKKRLGTRIIKSISGYKRRTLVLSASAAAVLLVIIGISAVMLRPNDSAISVYARNMQRVEGNGNTRLILSGEKEILIKSNDSKIAYAGNGNEIKVDTGVVSQAVDNDEMVYNTVIVPYGKRTRITLSDNSQVWLNSGSKLVYAARFASDKREVYLEGEAIFEVSHNKQKPFRVVTQDVEVKVLGTVFDLSAYTDDKTTRVVLENGSVEMKNNSRSIFSSSKVTLVPGTMATYDLESNGINQEKVDTKLYTSWREGYISCEKQSLGDILKKISRYYNVNIRLDDQSLADETFTGNLDLRNSASQVLAIIAEFISIKIENTNNQILITRI